MRKIEKRGPSALQDVWDWKEAVFRETQALNTIDALDWIHKNAATLRDRFDLSIDEPFSTVGLVREKPEERYKTKSDQ